MSHRAGCGLLAGACLIALAACAADRVGDAGVDPGTRGAGGGPAGLSAPLPPGNWTLLYHGDQDVRGGTAAREIYVSETRGVIDRVVLDYRVHLGKRYDFLPRESCRSPEYYYQQEKVGPGSGECWHVRAISLGTAGDPHWVNVAIDQYATARDLFLSPVMIGTRFIRYQDGELIQVDYLWNAELLLAPPAGRVWEPEDWSNAAVARDPAKRVIMETLRRWSEEWQPTLAAGS